MSGAAPKIVVLGMLSKMPVPGVIWQNLHYLLGFRELGYDPYYVEAHARTPSMLMERHDDDASRMAADLIASVMEPFGFGDRWAFHALHEDGRCYGMDREALRWLYRSSALLINLHGGTEPQDEHAATGRLVYLETDPVLLQMELQGGRKETIQFLERHVAFFTFAENYGTPHSSLPVDDRFQFRPTRQPVTIQHWRTDAPPSGGFSTVANWRQPWRPVRFEGRVYHWSKHLEFDKVLDLPARTGRRFRLALSGHTEEDAATLRAHGWDVSDALTFGTDLNAYRDFIRASEGEFTVAKEQNVRFRTGWFSDRSATYLAAGRPVITQDTGFGTVLPVGEGLFSFSSTEEAVNELDRVRRDYDRHSRAARQIAEEWFSSRRVLGQILDDMGLPAPALGTSRATVGLTPDLVLEPASRRPLELPRETVERVLAWPVPRLGKRHPARPVRRPARVSIVLVTWNHLVLTKLCVQSLFAHTGHHDFELIVADNGSTDGTVEYLTELERRNASVKAIFNRQNEGFAAANNVGLSRASGDILVLLNNDTVLTPRWLDGLVDALNDPGVGLVGPTTNRIGNEAEVRADYRTYAQLLEFAAGRRSIAEPPRDVEMLAMFCVAMRSDVFARIGPLDEQFEVGMLEDEDYSLRVHQAGLRVVCAPRAFVHHFGQGSFGDLIPTGEYRRIHDANRRRLERKWQFSWSHASRLRDAQYEELVRRIRRVVDRTIPPGTTVAVVSKGDDELVDFPRHDAMHFPANDEGTYAGFYPVNGKAAVEELERARKNGVQFFVVPATSSWWLDFYGELRQHLKTNYDVVVDESEVCHIFAERGAVGTWPQPASSQERLLVE